MARVEIYAKDWCPYCHAAKRLLERRGIAYDEVDVTDDPAREREMIERARRKSVPQIFVDGRHLGGFDELLDLDRQRGLGGLGEEGTGDREARAMR